MQRKVATACQLLLLVYFEVIMIVPLGAWNDQPMMRQPLGLGRVVLPAAIGFGQLLLLFATWRKIRILMWIGLVADTLWFASHLYGLWWPYLGGASPQYHAMYTRVFGQTTKLLPNFGRHLAPDGMHIVLDLLLLGVLVTGVRYVLQQHRGSAVAAHA
jgi:hypothetical protein